LPLLDLADLRALLTFLSSEDGTAELPGIGDEETAGGRARVSQQLAVAPRPLGGPFLCSSARDEGVDGHSRPEPSLQATTREASGELERTPADRAEGVRAGDGHAPE
jgi:hypothetical protein